LIDFWGAEEYFIINRQKILISIWNNAVSHMECQVAEKKAQKANPNFIKAKNFLASDEFPTKFYANALHDEVSGWNFIKKRIFSFCNDQHTDFQIKTSLKSCNLHSEIQNNKTSRELFNYKLHDATKKFFLVGKFKLDTRARLFCVHLWCCCAYSACNFCNILGNNFFRWKPGNLL
jgi:hypothetical protein